jgi:hypothetical protein
MLKIWGRNTSSNVQKVIWALAELNIPFDRIDVGGALEFQKHHVSKKEARPLSGSGFSAVSAREDQGRRHKMATL